MAGVKGEYRINIRTQARSDTDLTFPCPAMLLGTVSITALLGLAFAGSIGVTLLILACALPQYKVWWPFFAIAFYLAVPIPTIISKRNQAQNQGCIELAMFLTTGIIISSFALPIVLARASTIAWGACYLTICGNFVVFLAILAYFLVFDSESSGYGY